MTINTTLEGKKAILVIEGRLDTTTAPQLEAELQKLFGSVTELVLDFKDLQYVSSAGLRVLLGAQKAMNKVGSMVIKNVSEAVHDVFDITGFIDILTIE